MITKLRRTTTLPVGYGGTVGFIVEQTSDRPAMSLSQADGKRYLELGGNGESAKTANFTVGVGEAGKTFAFDATSTLIGSLPAAYLCPGAKFRFYVKQLPGSGAGHSVSPASTDTIIGNGFTGVVNKDAQCVVASDRVGDLIEVESLGGTASAGTYLITRVIGTWTREP